MTKILTFCFTLLLLAQCTGKEGSNKKNNNSTDDNDDIKSEEVYSSFPMYEEVLTYLDDNIKTGCKDCQFNIAKKPDGYFIQVLSTGKTQDILDELSIWDAESKEYLSLDSLDIEKHLKPLEDYFPVGTSEESINQYLEDPSKYNYDINGIDQLKWYDDRYDFALFYGYSDWDQDIIDFYEGESNLTLKDLENLARAHDFRANNYVHPGQVGNAPSFSKKLSKGNYTRISTSRVEKFKEQVDKSLYYYDEIIKQDPDYLTHLIGDVELKRSNNLVNNYYMLLSIHKDELALSYLSKVKFPEAYIKIAKKYLDGCAQNSFLFTNGDNDTYPLWYVQDALGYRKDITVLNCSLMSVPWYLTMNKSRNDLNMNFSISNCFKNDIGYFIMNENEFPSVKSVNELIEVVNDFTQTTHENQFDLIDAGKSFSIEYQGEYLPIKTKNTVFYLSDIATFDLLQNNPDKKAFFASNSTLRNYGWNNHSISRLLVVELSPQLNYDSLDAHAVHLMEDYITSIDRKDFDKLGNMRAHILMQFLNYLDIVNRDNPEKCKSLTRTIAGKFPDEMFYDTKSLSCLIIKNYMMANLDEDENLATINDFNETASQLISAVKLTRNNLKENLTLLKDIFSIYKTVLNSQITIEKRIIGKEHKEILEMIIDIINEADDNDVFENFKWTQKKYLKLKEDIETFLG